MLMHGVQDTRKADVAAQLAAGGAAVRHEREYVCGTAKVHLGQLARGLTRLRIDSNLQPFSCIRGAAALDWRARPGLYMQAQACVVGTLRCAAALQ
jgi:hypothetical protein